MSRFVVLSLLLVLVPAGAVYAGTASADLSVTKVDTPDPVTPGANLTYTITVTNSGPDSASEAAFSDNLPADTTFVSLSSPGGWTCSTPGVGEGGLVSCSLDPFPVGNAVFTLVVEVDPSFTSSEITNIAAASSTTADPEPKNQVGVATTTVVIDAELSVTKVDTPDPVAAGGNLTYTITVTNAGPNNAGSVNLSDELPAGTTFRSLAAPGGWSCSTPPVGDGGTVSCSLASFAPGSAVFTLTVGVDSGVPAGTVLHNVAIVTSPAIDPSPALGIAETTVVSGAIVSGTKTANGAFFSPGDTVTYTVVLSNTGPATQADNPGDEFVDVLPAELALVFATPSSGTASTNPGTNTVTWNGSIPSGGSVTITITATLDLGTEGQTVSNQGTINYDADGNGSNESTAPTDDPVAPGSGDPTTFVVNEGDFFAIPTLDTAGLALLALLLALGGAWVMRRRRGV